MTRSGAEPVLARPVRALAPVALAELPPPGAAGPGTSSLRDRMLLESMPRSRAIGRSVIVLILLVSSLGVGGLLLPAEGVSRDVLHRALVLSKWASVLFALVAAAVLVRSDRLDPAAIGLRWDNWVEQLLWAFVTFVAVYVALIVTILPISLLTQWIAPLNEDLQSRLEFMKILPTGKPLLALLLLSGVAIHEEVFFRGLLIPYLRRSGLGWVGAVVLSGGLFAVLHIEQGLLAIPQVFALAVAFGTCFVLSRSLLAVVLAHLAFNFLQFQLLRVLQPAIEQGFSG